MVRCAVSPDGLYLISGSEDGKPYIWDTTDEKQQAIKGYQCKLLDLVSDCQWNPRYNMFAVSGFGQNFPVLVYVYKRTQGQLIDIFNQGKGVQAHTEKAVEFLEQKLQQQGAKSFYDTGSFQKNDLRRSRGNSASKPDLRNSFNFDQSRASEGLN